MKHHNIYKDIVIVLLAVILMNRILEIAEKSREEQNIYEYMVTSSYPLTEHILKEFEKLEGIQIFYPVRSLNVTLKLEEYTMEVNIKGVDMEHYPLQLSDQKETLFFGSIPSLFISPECLEQFTDTNGHEPGKNKIEQWRKEYQQLLLEAVEEGGKKAEVKISGILKIPKSTILMDQVQMKNLAQKWGKSTEINQGCLRIKGKTNAEQAVEILENSGFVMEK